LQSGHFIVPTYKVYVEFGSCDGVMEILWRGKKDYHATAISITTSTFTKSGTSAQTSKSLVHRIKVLIKKQEDGENPNTRVRGLNKLVEEKKKKLLKNIKDKKKKQKKRR
jgi:hypothetical protein